MFCFGIVLIRLSFDQPITPLIDRSLFFIRKKFSVTGARTQGSSDGKICFLNKFCLFSIFGFTTQKTNSSIESNKPNRIMKKCTWVVLGSDEEFVIKEVQNQGPGHGAVY